MIQSSRSLLPCTPNVLEKLPNDPSTVSQKTKEMVTQKGKGKGKDQKTKNKKQKNKNKTKKQKNKNASLVGTQKIPYFVTDMFVLLSYPKFCLIIKF